MLYSGEMIEQSEWDKGFVEKEDLLKFLATKKSVPIGWCGTCNVTSGANLSNVKLLESDTDDLFLAEYIWNSDNDTHSVRYILVERNCSYTD